MQFQSPLIPGHLIRRYQRFLADVDVGGEVLTVHCPNPGTLMGLSTPGSRVWLSKSPNVARRLTHTLELVEVTGANGPQLVGINTGKPNRLIEAAILNGTIAELSGYSGLRREVRYGLNSRIDMLLTREGRSDCYVEVKNVHLLREAGLAEFPDCVTARGAKHLRELSAMVAAGHRPVLVFCVQRADANAFSLADDIDRAYAAEFAIAIAAGVECLVYRCHISLDDIRVTERIPLRFPEKRMESGDACALTAS
jgi:sugar fermentation stimulation protein A